MRLALLVGLVLLAPALAAAEDGLTQRAWDRWAGAARTLTSRGRHLASEPSSQPLAKPSLVARPAATTARVATPVPSPPPATPIPSPPPAAPGGYGGATTAVVGRYGVTTATTAVTAAPVTPAAPTKDCSTCAASWTYKHTTNHTCSVDGCGGYQCASGYLNCAPAKHGCLVAKYSDAKNCGACGHKCATGDVCCHGVCSTKAHCSSKG